MSEYNFDYSSMGFDVQFTDKEKRKIIAMKENLSRTTREPVPLNPQTAGRMRNKDQWMKDLFYDILHDVRDKWR